MPEMGSSPFPALPGDKFALQFYLKVLHPVYGHDVTILMRGCSINRSQELSNHVEWGLGKLDF